MASQRLVLKIYLSRLSQKKMRCIMLFRLTTKNLKDIKHVV
nr:MAG TPA: hypothetical protein [Bacteriophage sp.]